MSEAGSRKPEARTAAPRTSVMARVNAVVRCVIGAPDYTAYVRHMNEHHPGCALLSEGEFLDEQLTARYSTPGSRCC